MIAIKFNRDYHDYDNKTPRNFFAFADGCHDAGGDGECATEGGGDGGDYTHAGAHAWDSDASDADDDHANASDR